MEFAVPERSGDTALRRIDSDDDANAALVALYADAYTVLDLSTSQKREHYEARLRDGANDPGTVRIAAYRDGRLVGAMRWYDYTMRLRGRDVFAGGLGAVAVALDARRQGIGADLVRAFVDTYRDRGATLALLHPFRHAFYRRLGFGHGTKMNRFRFRPQELPASEDASHVRSLGPGSAAPLAACYERVRSVTNGLIVTDEASFRTLLDDPGFRAFAYCEGAEVRGYLLTRPYIGRAANANANELRVYEPIVESPAARLALFGFLRGLADQFAWIALETQDDALFALLRDPRDESGRIVHPPAYHETNVQGAGVMYRILDVPRALEALTALRQGEPAVWASLQLRDSLVAENSGAFDVALDRAASHAQGAVASLDIAEFSSLVVGSLRFRTLYGYGLAGVSDPAAAAEFDRLFLADGVPFCTTRF